MVGRGRGWLPFRFWVTEQQVPQAHRLCPSFTGAGTRSKVAQPGVEDDEAADSSPGEGGKVQASFLAVLLRGGARGSLE